LTSLDFDVEYAYNDDEIVIGVLMPSSRGGTRADLVLDTGTNFSTLHHSLLRSLGIFDVTTGRQATISLAGGQSATCWLHPIVMEIFGTRLTVDVAFCSEWEMKNLLGMRGFMDQVVFAVDHARHRLYLNF
jgi:predicted aspartyl protease